MSKSISRHIFSLKALQYRAIALIWVSLCSWFWTGSMIETIELTISIVGGKMILYGVMEHFHHGKGKV